MRNYCSALILCLLTVSCGESSSPTAASEQQSQDVAGSSKYKKIETDGDKLLLDEGHNVCVADADLCEKTIALTGTITPSNVKAINQIMLPGLKAVTLQEQEQGCTPAVGRYEKAHTGALKGANSLGIVMILSKDLSNPTAECAIVFREATL